MSAPQLQAQVADVDAAVRRRERREPARRLLELALAVATGRPRPAWYQATATWTSPW